MAKKFLDLFYRPIIFFFLLPLFQMALGIFFSLRYNNLNIPSFVFLYLFILMNQMLENVLLRIPNSDFEFNKGFLTVITGINILTILYFGFVHSWIAALVLLLFSLLIQGQFLFTYYDLDHVAIIITVLLKVILLNSFSFYTNAGFIQIDYLPYTLALLLPFFLYESSRVRLEIMKKMLPILLVLSYIIGIGLLWAQLSVTSLLLLVTLPFAWIVCQKEMTRKTTSLFSISFSLIYLILLFVTLL